MVYNDAACTLLKSRCLKIFFCSVNSHLLEELFLVALVICWKIWEVKNSEVHGSTEGFPPYLCCGRRNSFPFTKRRKVRSRQTLPQTWSPPDSGIIKLNVDVAFSVETNFFRISMVACNFSWVLVVVPERDYRQPSTTGGRSYRRTSWCPGICWSQSSHCWNRLPSGFLLFS